MSAFAGRGNIASLKLISSPADRLCVQAMTDLGTSLVVSDQLNDNCERFVCHLYGSKTQSLTNKLRYAMFSAGVSQSMQFPPTQDALCKHVQRANYQAFV